MFVGNEVVLKGQDILAQGNALGWKTGERIVRSIRIIKEKFQSRTKEMISIFRQIIQFNSVRKKFSASIIMFSRTVSFVFLLPRALPWAEIYWPYRP